MHVTWAFRTHWNAAAEVGILSRAVGLNSAMPKPPQQVHLGTGMHTTFESHNRLTWACKRKNTLLTAHSNLLHIINVIQRPLTSVYFHWECTQCQCARSCCWEQNHQTTWWNTILELRTCCACADIQLGPFQVQLLRLALMWTSKGLTCGLVGVNLLCSTTKLHSMFTACFVGLPLLLFLLLIVCVAPNGTCTLWLAHECQAPFSVPSIN